VGGVATLHEGDLTFQVCLLSVAGDATVADLMFFLGCGFVLHVVWAPLGEGVDEVAVFSAWGPEGLDETCFGPLAEGALADAEGLLCDSSGDIGGGGHVI
jgi:hypothetical protein